jgi:YggT family protein
MDYVVRATYDIFTLYMLLIMLRWLGPWLQLELDVGRLRYIGQIVDPLVHAVRKRLPSLGPMDFAPVVTVLGVWLIRSLTVGIMAGGVH